MIYFFPMIMACNVALVAVEVALPILVTAISAPVVVMVLMVNCMSSGFVTEPVISSKCNRGRSSKGCAKGQNNTTCLITWCQSPVQIGRSLKCFNYHLRRRATSSDSKTVICGYTAINSQVVVAIDQAIGI